MYDLFEQNDGFELIDQCGARFQATNKSKGKWTLVAVIGKELAIKMKFEITIYKNENYQLVSLT